MIRKIRHASSGESIRCCGVSGVTPDIVPSGAGYARGSGIGRSVKTAVILLRHGSREDGQKDPATRLPGEVQKRGIHEIVVPAFLQFGEPDLAGAIEHCVHHHAERVIIVPLFMQQGAHVARDIPDIVEQARRNNPGVAISVTDVVGTHPLIVDIVLDLAAKTGTR